jgi:hypothetical protein
METWARKFAAWAKKIGLYEQAYLWDLAIP